MYDVICFIGIELVVLCELVVWVVGSDIDLVWLVMVCYNLVVLGMEVDLCCVDVLYLVICDVVVVIDLVCCSNGW